MKKKPVEDNPKSKNCDCVKPELIERIEVANDGHLFAFCKKCQKERVVKIKYYKDGQMEVI